MSMLFAASFPERTVALILCGAEVKEDITDDWPWGESTREQFEESMATLSERWGRRPAALEAFLPSRGDDPALLDQLAKDGRPPVGIDELRHVLYRGDVSRGLDDIPPRGWDWGTALGSPKAGIVPALAGAIERYRPGP